MVIFLLLGVYNVFSGLRRIRTARDHGQHIRWYRQIHLLTGLEYLLLSLVFMMSLNLRNSLFPAFLKPIVVPFYLVVLLLSAVIAGFVIRQAILNARLSKQNPSVKANSSIAVLTQESSTDEERRANALQHRRERRQKAAAARRRRTGRA
jgi:hypothetical protein